MPVHFSTITAMIIETASY